MNDITQAARLISAGAFGKGVVGDPAYDDDGFDARRTRLANSHTLIVISSPVSGNQKGLSRTAHHPRASRRWWRPAAPDSKVILLVIVPRRPANALTLEQRHGRHHE